MRYQENFSVELFFPVFFKMSNCEQRKGYVMRDGQLFYRIRGRDRRKPVLVFVHGDDSNSKIWKCQQKFFCQWYLTIAVDMRGFGKSTRSPGGLEAGSLIIENHVGDLKYVLSELKLLENKIYLVGWSTGGLVAQCYTLTFPNDVSKLVLVDTAPQILNSPNFMYGRTKAEEEAILELIVTNFKQYIILGSQAAVPETCPGSEIVRATIAKQIAETGPEIAFKQTSANILYSSTTQLSQIQAPTLITVGLLDAVINYKASVFLALNIPNSYLVQFPAAGHAPFLTFYKSFNQYLLQFL